MKECRKKAEFTKVISKLKMQMKELCRYLRKNRCKCIVTLQVFITFIFIMTYIANDELKVKYSGIEEYQEVVGKTKNYIPESFDLYLTQLNVEATEDCEVVKVIAKHDYLMVEMKFEDYNIISYKKHKITNYLMYLFITMLKAIGVTIIIDIPISIIVYELKIYFDEKKNEHNC